MSTLVARPRRRGLGRSLARPSDRAGAAAALIVGALFLGPSTVASEVALTHTPPLTLAFVRFAIALVPLLWLCHRSGTRPVVGRTSILLGVTGIALPFICQNVALLYSSATNVILVIEGAIPVVTAILGAAFLRERLSGPRLAGLLLAVAGVGAIVCQGGGGFSPLGSALALAAGGCFAVYTVAARRTYGGGLSLPVLTGSIAVGVLLLAPLAAVEVAIDGLGPVTIDDGLLLLYLGLGGSALTQFLWAKGLVHLEASEVAVFGTLMPAIGVAAAALFLGDPLTLSQIAGALLVAVGMYLTARRDRRSAAIDRTTHSGIGAKLIRAILRQGARIKMTIKQGAWSPITSEFFRVRYGQARFVNRQLQNSPVHLESKSGAQLFRERGRQA